MFDISKLEWPDNVDADPPHPKLADFMYLPATIFGGPPGPAKLRIPTSNEPPSDREFENADDARILHLALKAAGIAKVYCRYDGGNDEGFAWFDHAEMASGETIDPAILATALIANDVAIPTRMSFQKDWTDERVVLEMLDYPLATNWAAALLGGQGFGTGEYSMYGAFVADLIAETITDDPAANPVVRNIGIEGVERDRRGFSSADFLPDYQASTAHELQVSAFAAGDRVRHTKFGSGVVRSVNGAALTIEFDIGKVANIMDHFVVRE